MLQSYESNAMSVQMGVKRLTHKEWKNEPEWCCGELMVNPLSCVVFTIRNGGMMCGSSRIVGLIACRIIKAGRVTRRKFCRVPIWPAGARNL